MTPISRRDFVKAGALGAAAAAAPARGAPAPAVLAPRAVAPVVVASANGHEFRNGGPRTAVEEAFVRLTRGEDVLDAVVAGVNVNELDPADDSVGYGGLPNADGVVQLDACCMHGPRRRAGGVAALEGVRTPSRVAQAVMDHTDHHLLVGRGAQEFARQMGFTVENDLNTPHSRQRWLEWKRRIDPGHWLDPVKRSREGDRVRREMMAEGLIDRQHVYGTINCSAVNARGEICGVTTTSGLSWKIPGRVGDSPILGAGLYVDGEVGAAGSTGRGEANLYSLASFLIVDEMRRGRSPKDAALEALRRIRANTVEKRLLNADGNPDFYVKFYVLNRKGEYAGVGMYAKASGKQQTYAVCTEAGPRLLPLEGLLEDAPGP
ncbi:MAG TPA: N(4)-(beta-N-acetylglucosaminyl)-L-asparaginase [Vicinamibacteria bacterium]|nr:N(4)-(beta-N-acetylglucosaminyl)-L-asparaginase [Vicinamibacteria bacterium]